MIDRTGTETAVAASDRLTVELAAAIERGELSLQYQPIVDLRSYRVKAVEALARWFVPGEGWRAPDRWIPLAETPALIAPFGRWALGRVLFDAATLGEHGHRDVAVALNVSPLQLDDPEFLSALRDGVARYRLAPGTIEIELIERHLLMRPDRMRDQLATLREAGCSIALDDFGTGDSSLSSLFNLPIDVLKIDRAFVTGLPADTTSAAIVDSTVLMAHRMGLRVIAEGVEDLDQLDFLRQVGCDYAQGYLLSPPLTPEALYTLLDNWDERRAAFNVTDVETSTVPDAADGAAGTRTSGGVAGVTVLIVDDEPNVLAIAEAVLRGAGATVTATSSVAEAVVHVTSHALDVVLFDLNMPGLNGWDFMELVRFQARDVALVAVSGYIDDRDRRAHRPDAVVRKPYAADALVEAVRNALNARAEAARTAADRDEQRGSR